MSVCTLLLHVHHGVEPHVLEDESINGVSSARLSSRKNFFLYRNGDFVLGCIDEGLLLLPLPPPLLSRRPGFSRFVEARFPDACQKVWPPFQRCSKSCEPSSWYSTVRLGRFEAHIIEVLFLLAPFWTVTHHPRITPFFGPIAPARTLFFGPILAIEGRDGCADEDENPGLSQTSDPAASWLYVKSQTPRALRVATFTRRTPPFHRSPNTTPIGLLHTDAIGRKKGVSRNIVWNIQWWYLYWVMILNSFLQFSLVPVVSCHDHLDLSWTFRQWNDRYFSVTNFISVRDSLTVQKSSRVYKIHQAQNYFSSEEIILFFRTLPECTCISEFADVHQCNKVDFPCCCFLRASLQPPSIPFPLLPLRLESTLLEVKDLSHILSVSQGKRLGEIDLQNCLNHTWLSVLWYVHIIIVYTPFICAYTRDSLKTRKLSEDLSSDLFIGANSCTKL